MHFPSSSGDAGKLLEMKQWGTGKWKSMENTFSFAIRMTYSAIDKPDLSKVTDLSNMFIGIKAFTTSIVGWDVSHITNMQGMFNASGFNQNIQSWDVSKVTNMSNMFVRTPFNQDIGNWDVGAVTNMHSVFHQSSFNQNIGSWNIRSMKTMEDMFKAVTLPINIYDAILIGWANMDGPFLERKNIPKNIKFNGGNSTVSTLEAFQARKNLRDSFGWVITDGDD